MVEIKNKYDCCGCGACENICPGDCITMKVDDEGFLYPSVDIKQCVHCDLCNRVCPVIKVQDRDVYPEMTKQTSYVAYAKDENLRFCSSSGGIFSLCAEWILEQGGVVFGAAYDKNFFVHHILVEHIEELSLLRGSKYMQSRTEKTFQLVRDFLNSGKLVLYTGTACQIAGLKGYLRKEYLTLYTIDVLCHGVPSSKVWSKYIQYVQNGYHLSKVNFRDKTQGWKRYEVTMKCENNITWSETYWKNSYMKMFLANICLRPSCYACKFKEMNRPSDITIGDAWGIENYMPEMDDDKGTSVVIVHSDRGNKILQSIQKKLVIKEAELDRILPISSDPRKSVTPHMNRKKFFKKLAQGKSFPELERCLYPTKIDRVKKKGKRMLQFLSMGK